MGKLNALMKLMVYIYIYIYIYIIDCYSSRMITWNTQQYLKEIFQLFLVIFYFFLSSFSFLLSIFKLSSTKKHHIYNLYRISYTLNFSYVIYYIVSDIYFGGRLLEDRFYCYSQQILSPAAKKSLIPYNPIQRWQQKNTEPLIL